MLIYTVHHVTTYRYRQPVAFGEHRMMFRPRESHDQHVLDSELIIVPEPASLQWGRDAFGNLIGAARFSGRASELRFDSTVRVAHSPSHAGGWGIAEHAQTFPVAFAPDELPHLVPYMERAAADAAAEDWAQSFFAEHRATSTLECVTAIAKAIGRGFAYERRAEAGIQAPSHTLESRSGTCRDFTVLMMAAVRGLGLPARFVSGYLYVPSRDRQEIRGGGATHAWAQVYLPGAGWVDFDPTNATVGNAGLIRVAVACQPDATTPLSGSFTGFRSDDLGMHVTVKVTRQEAQDEALPAWLRA
jgi:transglutaminase-like putative cysteine protease